ncbi:hypothetical protein NKH77_34160 [Streptomyces sp. M19]
MPRRHSLRAATGALALLLTAACSGGSSARPPPPTPPATPTAPARRPRRRRHALPGLGNGGYDVSHYGLDLDYVPDGNHLRAPPGSPPAPPGHCPPSTSTSRACGCARPRSTAAPPRCADPAPS